MATERLDMSCDADVPAWVLRMESAYDSTGYNCSGFEANLIAKEWRDNQKMIAQLKAYWLAEQKERASVADLVTVYSAVKAKVEINRLRGLIEKVISGEWCITDLQEAIGSV